MCFFYSPMANSSNEVNHPYFTGTRVTYPNYKFSAGLPLNTKCTVENAYLLGRFLHH